MPRRAHAAALLCSLLAIEPTAHAQGVMTTTTVTMPDGVKLATDVWRPFLDTAKHPVVLRRTPYGRALTGNDVNGLLSQGYIVVSQDVRGRGNSEGTFVPFTTDKTDGKATIDWVAQQDFADGNVGTYSGSAEAIVQFMAMAASPDALKCSHLLMASHDMYTALFPGGAWRTDLGTAWLNGLGANSVVPLWKSHEVHDDYWNAATLSTKEMAGIRHPVFLVGGMFDIFSPDEPRAFNELRANVPADRKDDMFLVLGPWTHGSPSARQQGELLYPEDAAYTDYVTDLVAYFAWCLKGQSRPTFPNFRYYSTEVTDTVVTDPSDNKQRITAQGAWKTATEWPPPGMHLQTLYAATGGKLAGTSPASCTTLGSLAVDPANPVPSLGGGNLSTPGGPYDQKTVDARPDVIVFATDPVTDALEIAGDLRARIWASSSTTDADVIVRVEVVTKEGRAIAMTDGVRRGRFVDGMDAVRALTPGEPALFDVTTGPLAVRLTAGQSLRIAVSSTSSPRYEPNPNTATPLATSSAPVATTVTIHCPLRVDVPVMSGQLPGANAETDAGAPSTDGGVADASMGGTTNTGGATSASGGVTPASGGVTSTGGNAPVHDAGTGTPSRSDSSGCGCAMSERSDADRAIVIATLLAWSALRRKRFGAPTGRPVSR